MSVATSLVVPLLVTACAIYAIFRKVDLFDALIAGAMNGLRTLLRIAPPVICLLAAIAMFRASGGFELLSRLLAPVLNLLGVPPECASLILIRPLSGSGALAAGSEIIAQYGPDSRVGRTAAVMLGASETTFYTVAVYFGATGIKDSRYALPAALLSDFTAMVSAALLVRILY